VALPAGGAEIIPTLTAGAFYSDNIRLAPPGLESGDLVGLVQPGLRVTSTGTRYDFNLDYRLQAIFYRDRPEADATFSVGTARLALQLVPERFTLTGSAEVFQTLVDPELPIPGNNLPISANRQNQVITRITPEWRQSLGSADLRLAYTAGLSAFGDDAFRDVTFDEFNTTLAGRERDRGLTWRLSHFYSSYDFEVVEIQRQSVEFFIFAELGSGWAPFLSIGSESDFADPTSAAFEYDTWSAGLRRTTERTRFEASYSDRSFGRNVRLEFQAQLGVRGGDFILVSYVETPQNPLLAQGGSVGLPAFAAPITPPPGGVDPDIVPGRPPVVLPPGLAQSFLARRGQVVVSKEFIRSSLSMTLFAEEFTAIPFGGIASQVPARNSQLGVSGTYNYRIGSKASLTGLVQYADRKFEQGDTTRPGGDFLFGRLGFEYRLTPRTALSTYLAASRQSGGRPGGGVLQFEQNIVGVNVTRTFL